MELVNLVEIAMVHKKIKRSEDLAKISNVSYFKINELLKGGESMKLSDLRKVLKALSIDIKFNNRGKK